METTPTFTYRKKYLVLGLLLSALPVSIGILPFGIRASATALLTPFFFIYRHSLLNAGVFLMTCLMVGIWYVFPLLLVLAGFLRTAARRIRMVAALVICYVLSWVGLIILMLQA